MRTNIILKTHKTDLMPSILEKLIQNTKADDYDLKSFAMLHCADSLKDNQLEGAIQSQVLDYFAKVIKSTNDAMDDLDQNQKNLCLQAMQNLADFNQFYPRCLIDGEINPQLLIDEIKRQSQQTGYCYLPGGWASTKAGHYVSVKVIKNADNTYDICFLNRGAGVQHHHILGKSDEKTKYDYQSHVYRFNLDSDSAKFFFHGLLSLQSSIYADKDCDEQDLYGLLALHGTLQEKTSIDEKRKVTPQRSGSCALTNTRAAVKDTLLFNGALTSVKTKRYEFYNKLASIVAAYKHLLATKEAQKDESELQLLELSLKELNVRLEKLYPSGLSDAELMEIRAYADQISTKVNALQQAILDGSCKEKPIPAIVTSIDWKPEPLTESLKPIASQVKKKPAKKLTLNIRRCPPEEVNTYLQEAQEYFSTKSGTMQIVYDYKKFLRSLSPTTASTNDPYWDAVPDEYLSDIVSTLAKLLDRKISYQDFESSLICYDIAAQIAPRIPELRLGSDFCLGLDDTFSNARFEDPVTFLTVSNIANNFKKRAENKTPVFNHTITMSIGKTEPRTVQAYIMSFFDIDTKSKILAKLKSSDLKDQEWIDIFLFSGSVRKPYTEDYMWAFPPVLNDIRQLSMYSQGYSWSCGYDRDRSITSAIREYYLIRTVYQFHKEISLNYSNTVNLEASTDVRNLKVIIPYNQIPTSEGTFRELSENVIYQPEQTRVKEKPGQTHIKSKKEDGANKENLPWSNDYNGYFKTYKGYFITNPKLSKLTDAKRRQLDESWRRIQLDKGFSFQRVLTWIELNIAVYQEDTQVVTLLLDWLYQYGGIYTALEDAADETNYQIKKTLNHAYSHFQNLITKMTDESGKDILTVYLVLCLLESHYRNWAIALNKSYLLDSTFPNCQAQLRQILPKISGGMRDLVAQVLLGNLKTQSPLSKEDMQYLLASRLIAININPQNKYIEKEASVENPPSIQDTESWHQLKTQFNNTIFLLPSAELNFFIKKIFCIMGYELFSSEFGDWEYEYPLLKSSNGRAIIDIEVGDVRIEGKKLVNVSNNVLYYVDGKILSELGIDINRLKIISIPKSTPIEGCSFQTDVPDGTRYYFSKPDKSSYYIKKIKKVIQIENKRYLCELVKEFFVPESIEPVKWVLGQQQLVYPYERVSSIHPIVWHDGSSNLIFAQHPTKPHKGVFSNSKGLWHQIVLKDGAWQRYGTVLINPQDISNSWEKEWRDYLSRFCNPNQLIFKATWDKNTDMLRLKTIRILSLDLHFSVKDNQLYCREHAGYFLSKQQGLKELNGLNSMLILENVKGDTKYLLPNAPFIKKGTPFYSRNPLNMEGLKPKSGYIELKIDRNHQVKGKTTEDNVRLALIFALQGDYQKAMQALKFSYSHKPNSDEIIQLMKEYNECKPNTPSAYAFYFHLHLRFLDHQFKWTKDYNPVSKEELITLEKKANENLANYMESISAQRHGVDIIPKCLLIPNHYLTHEGSFQEYLQQLLKISVKAFNDVVFSKTDNLQLGEDIDVYSLVRRYKIITSHKKQESLPYYPPVKITPKEQHKAGPNELNDLVKDIDDATAFFNANFVNLFELAISDSIDNERFNAYLFHIIHSAPNGLMSSKDMVAIIRYIANNKAYFKDIIHDGTTRGLVTEIFSRLRPKQKLQNSDLFSAKPLQAKRITIHKAAHWLEKENQTTFSLAHVVFAKTITQPLADILHLFCDSDQKKPRAIKCQTPELNLSTVPNPIVKKILQNYQQGYEKNLKREQTKYTLKPGSLDKLNQHVSQKIKDQQKLLDDLEQQIVENANQLPDEPKVQVICDLIKAARASGKRPAIDINSLIMCLLTQGTNTLNYSNPFLNQTQVDGLLQSICDYALEKSKLDQCKETLNVITEHSNTLPLPQWVEQLIGETLAKQRTYEPKDYPEILVYEYATGAMLREGQAEKIIELIHIIESGDKESYHHALLQFRAGGGKTAVLIPILAYYFARKGLLPVIVNTSELYAIAEQEIPESLKESLKQNIEVLERELDCKWTLEECNKLLDDLNKWRTQGKSLLLKSITWHSINLAYKVALDKDNSELADSAKQVLDFFATKSIKLEDEGHLISDPLQESIRTDSPSQTFTVDQTDLVSDLYHYLMGEGEGCAALPALTGIKDASKKTVSAKELSEIQKILVHKLNTRSDFKDLNSEQFNEYLHSVSKTRPQWLLDLLKSNPQLADKIILARSFIQTHFPHILTLQHLRDYGTSIHSGDLTAAPKHDGRSVSSHFADPLLVLTLTTQMIEQQGVPNEYIIKILKDLIAKHSIQVKNSPLVTEAEIQLFTLLPEKYLYRSIDSLDPQELAKDVEVQFYRPLIDYYLKTYAYPQIKVPTTLYVSTAADLQAGFKFSIIFTATPGLPETYPVQLKPEHFLLAQEFEAEVISTLLADKNKQGIMLNDVHSPEEFFANIKNTNPDQYQKITALIDRGALLANFENQKISKALQALLKENTLFFHGDVMRLESKQTLKEVTLKGTRIIEALQQQGFSLEEVAVFLFLDLAHTTGTDVKRPYQDRAGVTIGKEQTLTDTIQAAMRERQLLREEAQSVVWILFRSLYETIKPGASEFDLNEVFLWMVQNQARRDANKVLIRAYQGLDQLIDHFARSQVAKGILDAKDIKHTLSKPVRLSISEMYELMSKEENSDIVLEEYVKGLCERYKVQRTDFPKEMEDQIKRIINETNLLIPKINYPHGSELNAEVMHEQQQLEETKQEQQQKQELQINLNYHSNADIILMLETYDKTDDIELIFSLQNKHYRPFSLPGCKDISMPELLMNPRHFTPIQQQDYSQIQFMKPIDNLIIQRNPDGNFRFLACSAAGAKLFREQIKTKQFKDDSPSYIMLDSMGSVQFKSANTSKQMVRECEQSESFTDMISYLQLLNGQIYYPERMSEFIKKYGITQKMYCQLVSAIKKIHISPRPVELENLPYLESLCGWRELDDPIKKRLAAKARDILSVPSDQFQTKASSANAEPLPERAVIGYMPNVMESILPPSVLGKETKPLHLVSELANKVSVVQEEEPVPAEIIVFDDALEEKKLKFADELFILKLKANNLAERGCITAAGVAKQLHKKLEAFADTYFEHPTRAAYESFKLTAHTKINESLGLFEVHRGINHILANIALAILGLGIIYAAAVAINGGFFFNQTQSAKLLTKLDQTINEDHYKVISTIATPKD